MNTSIIGQLQGALFDLGQQHLDLMRAKNVREAKKLVPHIEKLEQFIIALRVVLGV